MRASTRVSSLPTQRPRSASVIISVASPRTRSTLSQPPLWTRRLAWRSMVGLASSPTTRPAGPTARRSRGRLSPVPQPMSMTRSPGATRARPHRRRAPPGRPATPRRSRRRPTRPTHTFAVDASWSLSVGRLPEGPLVVSSDVGRACRIMSPKAAKGRLTPSSRKPARLSCRSAQHGRKGQKGSSPPADAARPAHRW